MLRIIYIYIKEKNAMLNFSKCLVLKKWEKTAYDVHVHNVAFAIDVRTLSVPDPKFSTKISMTKCVSRREQTIIANALIGPLN